MEKSIEQFTNEIKNKTGIDIVAVKESDNAINFSLGEVFSDEKSNRTLFAITVRGEKYYLSIKGAGDTERNYAFLISETAKKYFEDKETLSRAKFLREAMKGNLLREEVYEYAKKYSIPSSHFFVAAARVDKGEIKYVAEVFNLYCGETAFTAIIDDKTCAVIIFTKDDGDYRSSAEYATFLAKSVYEERGVSVKILVGSTEKDFFDVSRSYGQAVSSLSYGQTVAQGGEAHFFKEYVFDKIIKELPDEKKKEYFKMLSDEGVREIFADEEIVSTAQGFLDNDLNVSETARKLFVHRNTLIYRLYKLEKATGLDVRKFSDALTFKIISALVKSI